MELLPVVALVGGGVCLYGAIKNKNPIGVVTAALTGKPLSEVPPLMQDSSGGTGIPGDTNLPGVIPKSKVPVDPKNPQDSNVPKGGFEKPPEDPSWLPDWLKTAKDWIFGPPRQGVDPMYGVPRGGGNGAV